MTDAQLSLSEQIISRFLSGDPVRRFSVYEKLSRLVRHHRRVTVTWKGAKGTEGMYGMALRGRRVTWEKPGTIVRGLLLGPAGDQDPQLPYAFVVNPDGEIHEFSRASESLGTQLHPVPAGSLLIIKYLGLAPGKPHQQKKRFEVQWRRRKQKQTAA
jgi:hypothetical protein